MAGACWERFSCVDRLQGSCYFLFTARMVKLVDTLGSGSSAGNSMEVQVLFRAKGNSLVDKYLSISHMVRMFSS